MHCVTVWMLFALISFLARRAWGFAQNAFAHETWLEVVRQFPWFTSSTYWCYFCVLAWIVAWRILPLTDTTTAVPMCHTRQHRNMFHVPLAEVDWRDWSFLFLPPPCLGRLCRLWGMRSLKLSARLTPSVSVRPVVPLRASPWKIWSPLSNWSRRNNSWYDFYQNVRILSEPPKQGNAD